MATNEIKLKITIDGKQANAEIQLTDENIKELYKSFKFGKQEVNGLTTRISMGFNNAREIIQGFQETFNVLRSAFGTPLKVAADFEQADISFKVLIGDAEKAKKVVKDLREFGAKTPLQFQDLQRAAQTLLSFGITADKVVPTLKTLGDVSMGNADKLQSLTLAFAQIQSTGHLMGQDLLQLINAGFNPLQVISKETGKSMAELKKEMSEGKISAEMVADAFKKATSEGGKFHNMLNQMSDSLAGVQSNFEDTITNIQASIGKGIAVVFTPTVKGLNEILSTLNEFSPTITGVIGSLTTLGGVYFSLKAFGLTPLVKELMFKNAAIEAGVGATIKASIADAGLVASEESLSVATLGVAGSFRAAGIAVKGFFSSLGPIGWAILGITTLVEIVGLFSDKADESAENIDKMGNAADKFAGRSLKELEQELKGVKEAVVSAQKALSGQELDVRRYEQIGSNLDVLKQKRAELAQQQKNVNNLLEYEKQLTEEIAKKREQIKASLQSSYKSLIERLEVEEQKTDVSKQLKRAEQAYNHDVRLLRDALDAKAISQKEYQEAITRLTTVYEHKRAEIVKKSIKETTGLLGGIEAKIQELEKQKATAKTVDELAEIEKKIKALENEKALIQIKVKFKLEGKDISDFGDLGLKIPPLKIPTELDTVKTADEIQELQDMKFNSIQNESKRELDILDAQYQADLQKYKDVVGAKEIIDQYYFQRKKELIKQSTLAEIQNILEVLNFIGTAVNRFTVVGKGIAIANAIWNTYQAATKALTAPPPLNFILEAAVIAAGMANVAKIAAEEPPKMPRFAEGGRLPEGQMGFIEGWHDELIAPEKDFIQIFQNELKPKIYSEISGHNIVVQNKELISKIDELNKSLMERPLVVSVGARTSKQIYKVGKVEDERSRL